MQSTGILKAKRSLRENFKKLSLVQQILKINHNKNGKNSRSTKQIIQERVCL